jgi:selenocysteine lyase/cysteine desulfurase
MLPENSEGQVDPVELEAAFAPDTILVTVMTANNETRSLRPITELVQVARGQGALFHTDTLQAVGRSSHRKQGRSGEETWNQMGRRTECSDQGRECHVRYKVKRGRSPALVWAAPAAFTLWDLVEDRPAENERGFPEEPLI